MENRVVIAGCRNYTNYNEARVFIDNCLRRLRQKHTVIILSGGCRGADLLGERYALENGFPIERYPARWDIYGKAAGPMRNRRMAENGDYIICFWDGKSRGTQSMIAYAKSLGKPIRIKQI